MAWTPRVGDTVIDNGLSSMKTAATTIWIDLTGMSASTNPTITEVISTYKAGAKFLGAGSVFPSAITAATGGRTLTTVALTAGVNEGSVSVTGTAAYWAITNGTAALTDGTTVYAVGNLSSTPAVTAGNTFTLSAFDITIKYQ